MNSFINRCISLANEIDYAPDAVVSKTLLKKGAGNLTLFAFDQGQELSEHTSPFDAAVQVVEGRGVLVIDGVERMVEASELYIMPANVPHNVIARERFKMLLIMIRSTD